MAGAVTAVDADEMSRAFLEFLVAIVAVGALFAVATLAEAGRPQTLVTVFGLLAAGLVGLLAYRIHRLADRAGHRIDPADAVLDVHVQDLADWGIVLVAVVGAATLVWRYGADVVATPIPVVLLLGLAAVGVLGVYRLFSVRLWVVDDAVIRVPDHGIANRYPIDTIRSVDVEGRVLRIRLGVPFADWSCMTTSAADVARLVEGEEE